MNIYFFEYQNFYEYFVVISDCLGNAITSLMNYLVSEYGESTVIDAQGDSLKVMVTFTRSTNINYRKTQEYKIREYPLVMNRVY